MPEPMTDTSAGVPPLSHLLLMRIHEYQACLDHADARVQHGALMALRAELLNLIHHLNHQHKEELCPHLTVLIADVPLFPLGQELGVCQWLHRLTEREFRAWPRRHVMGTPLLYPQIPRVGACGGVYTAMLCLN